MNVVLEPAEIPEWEAEDLLSGHPATALEVADATEARAMLDGIRLELPAAVDHRETRWREPSASCGRPHATRRVSG